MIERDRDFSFNCLQGYCLYPMELAAEEITVGRHKKYRVITVNAKCSKRLTDSDNNRYSIKTVYEMTRMEFMEWMPSAKNVSEEVVSIERIATAEGNNERRPP